MGDFIGDLTSFLEGDGLQQFKDRMAEQFRQDAPSKSGKDKAAVTASPMELFCPSPYGMWIKGVLLLILVGLNFPLSVKVQVLWTRF